jgi:hypothetical protein
MLKVGVAVVAEVALLLLLLASPFTFLLAPPAAD